MKRKHRHNTKEIEDTLQNWLSDSRRVVIAGIGNPLRRDDYIGIDVVRKLQTRTSNKVYLIECETVPESFIEPISEFKPTHIIIIDAALLDLEPGSVKLVETEHMASVPPISTHALPLQIFCRYLARTTGAKIALLAIQPKDTSFGEGLTTEVGKTAEHLTSLLSKILL